MSKFKRAQYDDIDIAVLKIEALERRLDVIEKVVLNGTNKSSQHMNDEGVRSILTRLLTSMDQETPRARLITSPKAVEEGIAEAQKQVGGGGEDKNLDLDDVFALWRRQLNG
jgi:hypothetical protein